ncbi:ATPase domain protein, partial [Glaesserella parasuis SW114]
KDQKAVKSAAETFRANPNVNVVEAITQLEVGEALISVLDEKGMPTPVEIAYVYPPQSQLKPISLEERLSLVKQDDLYFHYSQYVDNASAFETLNAQAQAQQQAVEQAKAEENSFLGGMLGSIFGTKKKSEQTIAEQVVSGVAQSVGINLRNQVTKQIMRGILGAITKK